MNRNRNVPFRLFAIVALAAALTSCASVTTRVVEMNPAVRYAPTTNVEVLFEPPQRPNQQIAVLEAEGEFGVSELELLEDMRQRAAQLGADAIVRTESRQWYQAPTAMYDPLYDPFFYPRRYYLYHPYGLPYGGGYRWVGGGYYYTAKANAIKYQPASAERSAAPPVGEAPPRQR
jgi:hypothetical protein